MKRIADLTMEATVLSCTSEGSIRLSSAILHDIVNRFEKESVTIHLSILGYRHNHLMAVCTPFFNHSQLDIAPSHTILR